MAEGDVAVPAPETTNGKLDLHKIATQFAQFMDVDTAKEESIVNDKIQSVLSRVEEFKHQLDHMHQNVTTMTEDVEALHENMHQNVTTMTEDVEALHENVLFLKELFEKIDQVEAFVFLVSRKVEAIEDCVTKMERNMDPGRLRKMFTSLPGVFSRKAKKPKQPDSEWHRPSVLCTSKYFSPQGGTEVPLSPDPR